MPLLAPSLMSVRSQLKHVIYLHRTVTFNMYSAAHWESFQHRWGVLSLAAQFNSF
jgi:hypothetical protein